MHTDRLDESTPHFHVYMDIGGGFLPDHAETHEDLESAKSAVAEWVEDMRECYAGELADTSGDPDYIMEVDESGTYAELSGGFGFTRRCYVEECNEIGCEAHIEDMCQ